ncbi:MAG TPA: CoA-transferase [Solirubrobacteraceae bacterium]|jgi:glutaconate CoA-transferase subunit A|nr:CoA-transferase [Solirubrobacteraceae bacterium]
MSSAREVTLAPRDGGEAPRRRTKLTTLEGALDSPAPGATIGIGGIVHQSRPVAAVRELIRRQVGALTVFSGPAAGYDIDLLIAAGLVETAYVPAVTFELHGMAPSYRRAVEGGALRAPGIDVLTLVAGYSATWLGLPFMPVSAWRGTDLTRQNPLATELPAPYAGTYAVAPIELDLFVMHAAEGDEFGNVRSFSPMVTIDVLAAKAAKRVVVVVDRLIDSEQIVREPLATTLAGHRVDAICVVPYGAHPTSSPGRYACDEQHLADYHAAAESARRGKSAALDGYFERFVDGAADQFAYLAQVGGIERMSQLEHDEQIGR